ncbi:ATP-dependent DNA helicase [Conexibacter sp. S30A1]|uniref:ATP-dependent helicase n=1 Tax=Conexibacter sp. S30A1 TaxID=2937800 RepID=UPI0020108368|nr:ATP-dependent DNA helicase [Conexibacter sp. S30A1]
MPEETDPIPAAPTLEGDAAAAVAHRGSHIQIIAAAGAGKTEVVSQRVAALLASGEDPSGIVAFTFTDKAAAELKERIRQRTVAASGAEAADQLGKLFVGTIHAYCFRLLQSFVPRYESYTPLDVNQLVNLLYREANRLKLKEFDKDRKLFRAVELFSKSVDVIENELIDPETLPRDHFQATVKQYYAMLDGYQFMSFGTQIVRAVDALQDPGVHARVTETLRHLIVDEYQDVNPAQERLIELLAKPIGGADLVVVGDDDQAVYQWRGSNVQNIVTFKDRYPNVIPFRLLVNRRSRPPIVALANAFAQSITGRLDKAMGPHRETDGPALSIAAGFEDEELEADEVAVTIERLHARGIPYRDIAILVRGRTAYPKLLEALEFAKVPVQPGGRTGLFEQSEAAVLGATYAWLADIEWAPGRFIKREKIVLPDLVRDYELAFQIAPPASAALRQHLIDWKPQTRETNFNVSLVGDFYTLLGLLGLSAWDTTASEVRNRLGTIARFTTVLADYETVTRRSRKDPNNPGEQVGGAPGDEWFYRNLALLLVNYANGNYDDFDGEEDLLTDAVALGTVHGAKGLEWPVVFLPSLTESRFPSRRTGRLENWLIPRDRFDAARYEGSDADERRLFYVALTRARDWVSLSSHQRVNKNNVAPSPYLNECIAHASADTGHPTGALPTSVSIPDLAVTYSQLAAYAECPQSYLLRNELGFIPPIKQELGYGNAIHHLMRVIAERTQAAGRTPTDAEVDELLTTDFFLPFANKPAHKEMREKAQRLVGTYLRDHQDDLLRTWATELPFELYLPGVVISGRADVIYDEHDGVPTNLAIVDYKTSTHGDVEPLQLQVYADAGRREGLTVGAAFVHDMQTATRHPIAVDAAAVADAESQVVTTSAALIRRDFTPKPELTKCRACDVRTICSAARLT